MQSESQLEQLKAQLKSQHLQQEVAHKKELMQFEFELNAKMHDITSLDAMVKEKNKEDRKDERAKIQASQQSEMIEQKKSGTGPKKFESSGNDVLGRDMGLGTFGPR